VFATVTYSGGTSGTMTLYLNGKAAGSVTMTPKITGGPACISDSDGPFHGSIEEAALFTAALSPSQVTALYDAGTSLPPTITSASSTSLVAGGPASFSFTATANPTASFTESGALPAGLSFVDNGNNTASLSGTPTKTGSFPIKVSATNSAGQSTQDFTISVDGAPSFTSSPSTNFGYDTYDSFSFSASGYPAPSFTESGSLPAGLSFSASGVLSGTPTAVGSFPFTVTASNGVSPDATQNFNLTIGSAPTISSTNSATFDVGSADSFTVTTTGAPPPSLQVVGTLPAGVSFSDNGNGTGTLSGTPASGSAGTYPIALVASSSTGAAPQAFALTVDGTPSFTSPSAITLDAGAPFVYYVRTAGGFPVPSLAESGSLPAGVSFSDNGNGTALISGELSSVDAGQSFPITIVASSPAGTVEQAASISVQIPGASVACPHGDSCGANGYTDAAPVIDSPAATSFMDKVTGSFDFQATGYPTPSWSETGSLPAGVSFSDNGNGTASLTGTPSVPGTYNLTVTAANGMSSATQSFSLTVTTAPSFTSPSTASLTVGTASSLTVSTLATPTAALTESGSLPAGLSFVDNGNGTATISGTPTSPGNYNVTLDAASAVGSSTQGLVLSVDQPLVITSPASADFTENASAGFVAQATGYPAPSWSETGALPSGVSLSSAGVLSGIPTASGSFPITVKATNAAGSVTQAFTIQVSAAASFTNSGSGSGGSGSQNTGGTFTTGSGGTTTVTAGSPTDPPVITESGSLPAGLTFTASGNTGTIAGTPAPGTGGVYDITITATSSSGSTSETLVIAVDQPAKITSPNAAVTTVGSASSFVLSATGYPAPSWSETGALPTGVSLSSAGVLSGIPAEPGLFSITLSADNGIGATATQTFVVESLGLPRIHWGWGRAKLPAFLAGQPWSYDIAAQGWPLPFLGVAGRLPSGLDFHDNGNGTATLSGTPAPGSGGIYDLRVAASSKDGMSEEPLSIVVDAPPRITAPANIELAPGAKLSTLLGTEGGWPTPSLSLLGNLPAGLSFSDNGNGTASLTGSSSAQGTYVLTLKATNSVGQDAAQAITVTILTPPGGGRASEPGPPAPFAALPPNPTTVVVPKAPRSSTAPAPSAPEIVTPPHGLSLAVNLDLAIPAGSTKGAVHLTATVHGRSTIIGTGSYAVSNNGVTIQITFTDNGENLLTSTGSNVHATAIVTDNGHSKRESVVLQPAVSVASAGTAKGHRLTVALDCRAGCNTSARVAVVVRAEKGGAATMASATRYVKSGISQVALPETKAGVVRLARVAKQKSWRASLAIDTRELHVRNLVHFAIATTAKGAARTPPERRRSTAASTSRPKK
jgi:hypothetical protein